LAVDGILLIRDIALIMVSALLFGYLASRLGQPPMIGYLLAGLAIGPASRLVLMPEEISLLANVGVTLLMFMVGLEFSTKRIKKIWKVATFTSVCEICFMFVIGVGIGLLVRLSLIEALFLGTALGMTGTIVCIKALSETGQLDSSPGRIMIGILVIEDIVAIGALSMLDSYARTGQVELQTLVYPVVGGISFLILMLMVGKHFLPKIFAEVGKTKSRELFILAIFGVCMGIAAIAFSFQISMILGAFIAGLMLSESEYHLRISQQIESFKDIFLIIFFVSVGLSVNPVFLIPSSDMGLMAVLITIGSVIGLVLVILLAKPFINTVLVRLFKYPSKTALFVGLGMVNIGEFSFVIMKVGYDAKLVSEHLYAIVVLTALITMAGTAYMIKNSGRFYKKASRSPTLRRVAGRFPDVLSEELEDRKPVAYKGHVVILGAAGGISEHLIEFLRIEKKEFVVVDNDMGMVEHLRELKTKVFYGDPSNPVFMKKANVKDAKVIVISLTSPFDTQLAAEHARALNPGAYMAVRIQIEDEEPVIRKYANEVVLSHFVAGRQLAKHALNAIGYSDGDIEKRMSDADVAVLNEFEIPGYARAAEGPS
jgi:CPA2 family monovalent cation:H+ antiporter-2